MTFVEKTSKAVGKVGLDRLTQLLPRAFSTSGSSAFSNSTLNSNASSSVTRSFSSVARPPSYSFLSSSPQSSVTPAPQGRSLWNWAFDRLQQPQAPAPQPAPRAPIAEPAPVVEEPPAPVSQAPVEAPKANLATGSDGQPYEGPFHRWEFGHDGVAGLPARKNNSEAILQSRKLLAGKGIGTIADKNFAFKSLDYKNIKSLASGKDNTLITFYVKPGSKHSESYNYGRPVAGFEDDELNIVPAASYAHDENGKLVVTTHDKALHAHAKAQHGAEEV